MTFFFFSFLNTILTPQTGKVDPHHPRVSGHRGKVLDIKWNPFDDYCIASCSEDATVWKHRDTHTHTDTHPRAHRICTLPRRHSP